MSLNKNDMINATTNVAGMEILNRELADLIWQGVNFMSNEVRNYVEGSPRKIYLTSRIKQAIVVHHCLLGAKLEVAESAANDYINFINVELSHEESI